MVAVATAAADATAEAAVVALAVVEVALAAVLAGADTPAEASLHPAVGTLRGCTLAQV